MCSTCVEANVILRRSVCRLTQAELNSDVEKQKRYEFDQMIRDKFGNSLTIPSKAIVPYSNKSESREKAEDEIHQIIEEDPVEMTDDRTSLEHFLLDMLIHAEVLLLHNG